MKLKTRGLQIGQEVSGVCYVEDCAIKTYADGTKKRLVGTLKGEDGSIVLKSFETAMIEFFENQDLLKKVVKIRGIVGEYQGVQDIALKVVDMEDTEGLTEKDFIKVAPVEKLFEEFKQIVVGDLSPEYYKVIKVVLGTKIEEFNKAYAGSKMHDAYQGGLLSHTVKMLRIGKLLLENDERLLSHKDLLLAGIVLHDAGKIYEMEKGVYTKYSYVTHRGFGVEMLAEKRKEIVELVGEEGYYQLIAVIQGHHGEWGDEPRTMTARIVHLIDMLDSQVTGMLDKIERGEEQNGVNRTIYVDGANLVI